MAKPRPVFVKLLIAVIIIALVAALAWTYTEYEKARDQIATLEKIQNPDLLSDEEMDALLAKVEAHILLPEDEEPLIATILDVESLKADQPFYKNAENEDQLLLYEDRAIIYSPKKDKVINVGPVNIQSPDLNIDVRNGSKTPGVAGTMAEQLKERGYNVNSVGDTPKDYNGIILVKLTDKDVSSLEAALGVKAIEQLPEGEVQSTADALILVGN
jgi:hypothetical protein